MATKIEGHEAGSDAALVLPASTRALKTTIQLSQALDQIVEGQGAKDTDPLESMLTAFKFVGAYSGILNEAKVREEYEEDFYRAMDAVNDFTRAQFKEKADIIAAGIEAARKGNKNQKLLDEFRGRWSFMKDILEKIADMR